MELRPQKIGRLQVTLQTPISLSSSYILSHTALLLRIFSSLSFYKKERKESNYVTVTEKLNVLEHLNHNKFFKSLGPSVTLKPEHRIKGLKIRQCENKNIASHY